MIKRMTVIVLGACLLLSMVSMTALAKGKSRNEVKAEVVKAQALQRQVRDGQEQIRALSGQIRTALKGLPADQRKDVAAKIKGDLAAVREQVKVVRREHDGARAAREKFKAARGKRDGDAAVSALQELQTRLSAKLAAEQSVVKQLQAILASIK